MRLVACQAQYLAPKYHTYCKQATINESLYTMIRHGQSTPTDQGGAPLQEPPKAYARQALQPA